MVQYEYDAWGNHTISGSNSALGNINPFRYRSYYFDTETKLYFLQTRYYDPEVGRFINIDSIEYADPETINGLNLYAYCGNNPVMNIDPEGTWSWKGFGKIFAAVAIVVVIAAAVALTAGAATFAIATVAGVSAATTTIAMSTIAGAAFVAGYASGIGEVFNQVEEHGAEEINLNSVAVITAGDSIDGALNAASCFTGPAGTALLSVGRVCVSGLKNYYYGNSEKYEDKVITTNMLWGMVGTAAASLLMYGNTQSKAVCAPFNIGMMKFGLSIFKIFKNALN